MATDPIYRLCQLLNDSGVGTAIRESDYLFPVIETVHVLAIALLVGTVAILDLRLLGLVMKEERVEEVAGQILPLTWAGFAVMVRDALSFGGGHAGVAPEVSTSGKR